MKKEDLKASLGKIKPREELVNSTLLKMREEREKEFRRETRFAPAYARGLRVAGAFCAFAIVFCLGFFAARQGFMPETEPDETSGVRVASELATDNVSNPDYTASQYNLKEDDEWIVISGRIDSMQFVELTEDDAANGVDKRVKVIISVFEVEAKSENLSRKTISTEINTELVFHDNDALNSFVNVIGCETMFTLIPTGETGWEIVSFSPAE